MKCPHCKKIILNKFSKNVRNKQCPYCHKPVALVFSGIRMVKVFLILLSIIILVGLLDYYTELFDPIINVYSYFTSPYFLGIVTIYLSLKIVSTDNS